VIVDDINAGEDTGIMRCKQGFGSISMMNWG
jgi:hypothetical protein